MSFCESCINAAFDEVGGTYPTDAIMVLASMADLLPDHLCDHGETMGDSDPIPCDCAAHSFNRI